MLARFCERLSVDAWFAVAPAGMEIIIAMEKPNAMITRSARIFLLEIFLIARVPIPKLIRPFHFSNKEDDQ